MAVDKHKVHLQSPGFLLGLKSHKAVSFGDPGPVLDDLCLLHIAKGWEQRVKLGLCCGWADTANKNPEKFLVTINPETILCLDIL